jgi:hypothetical protein
MLGYEATALAADFYAIQMFAVAGRYMKQLNLLDQPFEFIHAIHVLVDHVSD